jgi:hypothetical protein
MVYIPNTLVLTHGTMAVTLSIFAKGGADRSITNEGGVDHTPIGSAVSTGARVTKHIWEIAAFLSEEEWAIVQRIYRVAGQRRNAHQDQRVYLDDYCDPWIDDTARLYALAPDATVTAAAGLVTYYRRFAVRLLNPKSTWFDNAQTPRKATFTLIELGAIYA